MAFVHRQRHAGLWLPQMGPAPGMAVEIDTAHPLASGLAGFWLLRDGRDLTNGTALATPQTGAVFGVGPAGPSLAAGQLSAASQLSAFDAQAFSLWIGFNQSSSNPSQVVLRKDDNNGQHGWWIELNGSGAISLTAVGSQNASLSASASGWSTARSLNGALITSDRALGNGAVLDFYGDGARWGGGTLAGTAHLSDATYPLLIGSSGFSGNIYAIGIWRRQLAADDALRLTAEPYALLRPIVRRTYVVPVASGVLTGTAAAAASTTGTLTGIGNLAGTAAAAATTAGILRGLTPLTGSAAAAAGTGGALTGRGALVGTAAAQTTTSGTLASAAGLSGTASAQASTAGTLTGLGALAGTATAAAVTTGTLSGLGALSGTAAAAATTSGTVSNGLSLSGTASAQATTGGTLTGRGALSGLAAATATASGSLTGGVNLTGLAAAQATTGGTVSGIGALTGPAAALGITSAILVATSSLAGAASAQALTTATLSGLARLVGAAIGRATTSGTLVAGLVPVIPPGLIITHTVVGSGRVRNVQGPLRLRSISGGLLMYAGQDFAEISPNETEFFAIDFARAAPGDTLTSAAWQLEAITGTDASASTRITGVSAASLVATAQLTGLQAGVRYRVTARATLASGQIKELYSFVNCGSAMV